MPNQDEDSGPSMLPTRVLIVASPPLVGAPLAADFAEARLVAPDELEETLAQAPGAFTCFAVSGVPVAEGALGRTVRSLLDQVDGPLTVLLAVSQGDHALLSDDSQPLVGLSVHGVRTVGGIPCIVLCRGVAGEAPDLEETLKELGPALVHDHDAEAVLRARLDVLEEQLRQAEQELARTAHSAEESPIQLSPGQGGGSPLARARSAVRGRGPGARRAGALGVGISALAAVIVASIGTTRVMDGESEIAAVLALEALALLTAAYLVRGVRRIGGGIGRLTRVSRRAFAAERKRASRFETLLREQGARVDALQRQVELVAISAVDTAKSTAKVLADLKAHSTLSARAVVNSGRQVQAVVNLFSMMPVRAAVPPMGGWAASADAVLVLIDELVRRRPKLVVECGSGVSTLWLSLAIRHYGLDTRVVALEHDPGFAEGTREVLRRHGVDDIAEVRDAPLVQVGLPGHDTPWYTPSAVEDLSDIGLLFVDGPPEATGPRVRYPAVPVLHGRLAAEVTIVLDDYVRASEKEIVGLWVDVLPDFELSELPLEKGAAILRR